MRIITKIGAGLLGVIALGAAYLSQVHMPKLDARMNAVVTHKSYDISPEAKALHQTLSLADMHADILLWGRNPAHHHDHGHADIPRLREGGVRLQVFSAVTKSPKNLNFDNNSADAPDDITLLSIAQLWPARTWGSLYERAAYQAQRLQKIERADDMFIIARTRADIAAMRAQPDIMAGLLLTEGSHPLEGKLYNIDRLYDEGYRAMGLTHFFDNALAGSLHGVRKGGLTEFGRQAVAKMQSKDIIVDIAHASVASVRDLLEMSTKPILLSHGGLRSACPSTANRNLPDDMLIEIVERGGLIAIGYFNGVICDISPDGIAETLIKAVAVLGENAVALGSDFDGSVTTALDASELAAITDALLDKGMAPSVIKKVMGENAMTFFAANLPQ